MFLGGLPGECLVMLSKWLLSAWFKPHVLGINFWCLWSDPKLVVTPGGLYASVLAGLMLIINVAVLTVCKSSDTHGAVKHSH